MSLSCRCFRIIAVLVISGKQMSSGLLQLCGLYLCMLAKLSATVILFNIFSTSRKHFVFQAILSHRAITSTNVDSTASQTTVPGYDTLSKTIGVGSTFTAAVGSKGASLVEAVPSRLWLPSRPDPVCMLRVHAPARWFDERI